MDGVRVYQPYEKSVHVMNGVGTLRLPPNSNGEWLLSVSSYGDASQGVPVLVRAEVWDQIQKGSSCEGRMISGQARWQPMDTSWSAHFRSTGDIPAGYLVLQDPDAITVEAHVARTWVYPFTIMEYQSKANELFDYVYCGAHTDEEDFRSRNCAILRKLSARLRRQPQSFSHCGGFGGGTVGGGIRTRRLSCLHRTAAPVPSLNC